MFILSFANTVSDAIAQLRPLVSAQSTFIICYLAAFNTLALLFFGADKIRAISGKWRIPEKLLIALTVFGGSLGALLGMILFRHKTKHIKFTLTVPFFALLLSAFLIVFFVF